jgi:CRP/FNR family transcriptional regulator
MLASVFGSEARTRRATPERSPRARTPESTGPLRTLARGEILFQEGDTRGQIYLVERGALCHYVRFEDGRREVIEFAFPGDMIGFGHLEAHVSTAQAMVETSVSLVSAEAFKEALAGDASLAARVSAAADRDFDFLRARAIKSGLGKPIERVASFLAALSQLSAHEGRDPMLVTDDIPSGVVAGHLDMTIDGLVRALRELEQRGVLRSTEAGLRIADLSALEKLASAA